jgi:hypothetical protein
MFDPEPLTPEEGLAMGLSLMAAWFELRGDREDDSDLERDDGWPEAEFRKVPWPPPR